MQGDLEDLWNILSYLLVISSEGNHYCAANNEIAFLYFSLACRAQLSAVKSRLNKTR